MRQGCVSIVVPYERAAWSSDFFARWGAFSGRLCADRDSVRAVHGHAATLSDADLARVRRGRELSTRRHNPVDSKSAQPGSLHIPQLLGAPPWNSLHATWSSARKHRNQAAYSFIMA